MVQPMPILGTLVILLVIISLVLYYLLRKTEGFEDKNNKPKKTESGLYEVPNMNNDMGKPIGGNIILASPLSATNTDPGESKKNINKKNCDIYFTENPIACKDYEHYYDLPIEVLENKLTNSKIDSEEKEAIRKIKSEREKPSKGALPFGKCKFELPNYDNCARPELTKSKHQPQKIPVVNLLNQKLYNEPNLAHTATFYIEVPKGKDINKTGEEYIKNYGNGAIQLNKYKNRDVSPFNDGNEYAEISLKTTNPDNIKNMTCSSDKPNLPNGIKLKDNLLLIKINKTTSKPSFSYVKRTNQNRYIIDNSDKDARIPTNIIARFFKINLDGNRLVVEPRASTPTTVYQFTFDECQRVKKLYLSTTLPLTMNIKESIEIFDSGKIKNITTGYPSELEYTKNSLMNDITKYENLLMGYGGNNTMWNVSNKFNFNSIGDKMDINPNDLKPGLIRSVYTIKQQFRNNLSISTSEDLDKLINDNKLNTIAEEDAAIVRKPTLSGMFMLTKYTLTVFQGRIKSNVNIDELVKIINPNGGFADVYIDSRKVADTKKISNKSNIVKSTYHQIRIRVLNLEKTGRDISVTINNNSIDENIIFYNTKFINKDQKSIDEKKNNEKALNEAKDNLEKVKNAIKTINSNTEKILPTLFAKVNSIYGLDPLYSSIENFNIKDEHYYFVDIGSTTTDDLRESANPTKQFVLLGSTDTNICINTKPIPSPVTDFSKPPVYTICFWCNIQESPTQKMPLLYHGVLYNKSPNPISDKSPVIYLDKDNKLTFSHYNLKSELFTKAILKRNRWTHVAIVFNASNNQILDTSNGQGTVQADTIKLYIDGVNIESYNKISGATWGDKSNKQIYINPDLAKTMCPKNGSIILKEMFWYNTCFSDNSIKEIMENTDPTPVSASQGVKESKGPGKVEIKGDTASGSGKSKTLIEVELDQNKDKWVLIMYRKIMNYNTTDQFNLKVLPDNEFPMVNDGEVEGRVSFNTIKKLGNIKEIWLNAGNIGDNVPMINIKTSDINFIYGNLFGNTTKFDVVATTPNNSSNQGKRIMTYTNIPPTHIIPEQLYTILRPFNSPVLPPDVTPRNIYIKVYAKLED